MTDSTSIGLALRYSGLKLTASDDVLTTNHDHYAVEAAARLRGANGLRD
jgi:isopenicillin-N epimerase